MYQSQTTNVQTDPSNLRFDRQKEITRAISRTLCFSETQTGVIGGVPRISITESLTAAQLGQRIIY